jgi:hypothetical protein
MSRDQGPRDIELPIQMFEPTHCEATRQSCATPWQCDSGLQCRAAPLVTANNDGSSPEHIQYELTLAGWIACCSLVGVLLALLYAVFNF